MKRRGAAALLAGVLVATTGCTITTGSGPAKENSVSAHVEQTHRFEVDLSGPMPTREQVGIAPGKTMADFTADTSNGLQVTYKLAGGRTLTMPATSVTVSTTELAVTDPAHPENDDDAKILPNEVAATQDFDTKDEARRILLAHADLLGLDPRDIELWYATAPAGKGPSVVLDKRFFSGKARIGYVDVSVGVFISDLAYIIWDLSWDPPIPGHTYGTDGVPRPTSS